jgi:hypothetical protein
MNRRIAALLVVATSAVVGATTAAPAFAGEAGSTTPRPTFLPRPTATAAPGATNTAAGDAGGATPTSTCRPFTTERQKAHADVAKRLTTLDQLAGVLGAAQDPFGVNGGETAALADAKTGLTALDQKIQTSCYTDRVTLNADARTIFTSYRVYWLRMPQTHIIESADHLGVARQTLGASATKLAGLVGDNQKAQADLAAMNQALSTSDAHVGNPPSLGGSVAAVPGLAPAVDMTADVTAMKAARADLEASRKALAEARRDAQRVVADLGGPSNA